MPSWNHKLFALIAVSALLSSGCGGSDATAEPLSKADFIRKADAICDRANEAQLAALGKMISTGNSPGGVKQEVAVVLPPVRKEVEDLSELGAPVGDQQEIATIVSGLEAAIAKTEEDPVKGMENAFTKVDRRAINYGLPHCAGLIIGGAK